jgi:hypothetical protein
VLGATLESQPGKPSETAVQPLRASQRAWIAERDRCGRDRACLRRHYERRLAVLTFQPDPEAPEPVDRFVGRFTDGRQATAAILRLAPDRALILMSDIETSTARWICEFQGLGQIGADGRTLVASTPDLPGYELRMTARGLELEDLSGGDWCGVSGAIASPLQRQPWPGQGGGLAIDPEIPAKLKYRVGSWCCSHRGSTLPSPCRACVEPGVEQQALGVRTFSAPLSTLYGISRPQARGCRACLCTPRARALSILLYLSFLIANEDLVFWGHLLGPGCRRGRKTGRADPPRPWPGPARRGEASKSAEAGRKGR